MRVLITRPEREATTLAAALAQRGHQAVIAPLFSLQLLRPAPAFFEALAACQAVLLTSANGARALAEASEQRSKPVYAVGDTTAATAEGLGFTSVFSAAGDAAALAELVRSRLDPAAGPLLHVSGVDVAGDPAPPGFDIRRFALYEAREATVLPASAEAALQARALDAATFFSPRASTVFARLVGDAGLADACRGTTAIAISAAAARPLQELPFRDVRSAAKPSRQAVLDEIDRLAEAGVQGQANMSDTPPPAVESAPSEPVPPVIPVKRGLGVIGAFVVGVIAAVIVLAAALFSLPYWPQEARNMWRGTPAAPQAAAPRASTDRDRQQAEAALRQQIEAEVRRLRDQANEGSKAPAAPSTAPDVRQQAENEARQKADAEARRALDARLEDLDKRVRAAATTAAQADRPASDATLSELRTKVEALENKQANPETDKEIASLKGEVAALKAALNDAASKSAGSEQKAVSAARASAVIGIAARLSASLEAGLPFAADLALLAPLAQTDARIADVTARLQPLAAGGVPSRATLAADFPSVAKAALADDLADDSFGQRVLGKIKAIISLRRVGADVPGDSVEARLARAEAALNAGDIAKTVAIMKTLPPETARATAKWLQAADAQLAAQQAVDQLAAHAVAMLGTARP